MKGQFMLVTSIVIGFILVSVSSVVTEVQSTQLNPEDDTHEYQYIQTEAKKITEDGEVSKLELSNYRNLVDKYNYQSEVKYWNAQNCLNITLTKPSERIEMTCIG